MSFEIIRYPVTFEYEGKIHNWIISFQKTDHRPTVFHVNDDQKYFVGQLIYYTLEGRWRFFYCNNDNVQDLADILAEVVIKGYQ